MDILYFTDRYELPLTFAIVSPRLQPVFSCLCYSSYIMRLPLWKLLATCYLVSVFMAWRFFSQIPMYFFHSYLQETEAEEKDVDKGNSDRKEKEGRRTYNAIILHISSALIICSHSILSRLIFPPASVLTTLSIQKPTKTSTSFISSGIECVLVCSGILCIGEVVC